MPADHIAEYPIFWLAHLIQVALEVIQCYLLRRFLFCHVFKEKMYHERRMTSLNKNTFGITLFDLYLSKFIVWNKLGLYLLLTFGCCLDNSKFESACQMLLLPPKFVADLHLTFLVKKSSKERPQLLVLPLWALEVGGNI